MNLILIIIPIVILIIGIGGYFTIFPDENIEISENEQTLQSENLQTLIQTNVKSLFKVMAYENDFEIIEGEKIWRNVFYELDESNNMIYDNLKNNKKSAVIFPIFTAAAYSEPGFYTFYRGECDREFHGVLFRDDDCLTVKLEEEYNPLFTSSANGLQVLNLLDYDILTDISIHQNPEILSKYEKIILLHNEYVTSVEFDAILSHPNVIYLYPNALYAEVNFDEELWEISLVRGHNYPEITIRNGFDWKFDNSPEEYDVTCDDMKFSKIDNGWMLNCYPENVLHKNKELLKQIKDF
ncbi:MAG: hypothetical protein HN605_01500 [Thaumarchaeota archaeon]|jgi:hypothetical protein|nr:hypothetical protein [Nitrososphaerota archaeon]MBT4057733.1 hypothetical protein [Nitrososphaerota archaeon]MBT4175567.1 hypothetical protein [Nitrososphaerota archaeon]MBT4509631.1 hypothetical protein [Nitrososphaerota archaeon]MBT4675569.1 hypothetical protein [Nitrososphaerota archaeon]